MKVKTLITGFPRIGEQRELKQALEDYWAGIISSDELHSVSSALKKRHWSCQKGKGIDLISCNDFSLYDNMLDTALMLNTIPERFRKIKDSTECYFTMARGTDGAVAMEMTKWFNTNYHYIVPELTTDIDFRLDASKIISEYREAVSCGIKPKINIIGPLTFLGLSRRPDHGDCYDYFSRILPVYKKFIEEVSELDSTVYLQIEEPVFVKDPSEKMLCLLRETYSSLPAIRDNVNIIVTTYFEHSSEATAVLADTPVWGIGLDFIHGKENIKSVNLIGDKKLVVGIVDGRNIWINNIRESIALLNRISRSVPEENIIISTSCSLLHLPYTVENEPESYIKNRLSFAVEKTEEVALISKIFNGDHLSIADRKALAKNDQYNRRNYISGIDAAKQKTEQIKNSGEKERKFSSAERVPLQKKIFKLPLMPTTTIGSFPQTAEMRKLRLDYKKGTISLKTYESGIREYIDNCIAVQEEIGLDVLVHGEPERNDMVEYFSEMLNGFMFTSNGWVQSYGSRCVKPPVIYGDVERREPMTLKWIKYAQNKTEKIMKGMLTGPVTILNWSFVRDDIPRSEISRQIAYALSDEIKDLQSAGIKIIQVDEAAFKEGYPLRGKNIPEYERWAVENFKLAVHTAGAETQIHTHMCYSDFNDIIETIEAMDADVITVENTRSGNEVLKVFTEKGCKGDIGPGIYDIHSPRIPSVDELMKQISSLLDVFPAEKLWINPDCGLKTRKWEEVKPALKNMVEAVKRLRPA